MGRGNRAGFTLVELVIVILVGGILVTISAEGMLSLNRQQREERLARQIVWEVTLARSYALRAGISVALVADETTKTLTVRDVYGNVYRTTDFGLTSDFAASKLDIGTAGDSLAFSSRGICLNCNAAGTTPITVQTPGRPETKMFVTILGRAELERYSRT